MARRRIIEVDLCQAESRFIAWDGPLLKMQQMYRDGVDIHKYVASIIFGKPIDQITPQERYLGKKSGHGRNYKMGASTFAGSCLKESDLVISEQKAQAILDGYSRAWSGDLEKWQRRMVEFVKQNRYLETPFKRRRYFYDRMTPMLEKEICAYRPQATIPEVINFLIKRLYFNRPAPSLRLLMQGHDSVKFECDPADDLKCIESCKAQAEWNPIMTLRGGDLRIPIEIKIGWNFKEMEVVFKG